MGWNESTNKPLQKDVTPNDCGQFLEIAPSWYIQQGLNTGWKDRLSQTYYLLSEYGAWL